MLCTIGGAAVMAGLGSMQGGFILVVGAILISAAGIMDSIDHMRRDLQDPGARRPQ
jgi:hypothetical protein